MSETWDLWFPGAGATGMSFARARVDPAVAGDRVLVHAAPESLEVVVRDDDGRLVVLPGGEAGVLTAWEHADDRSWWRWSVELSNSR